MVVGFRTKILLGYLIPLTAGVLGILMVGVALRTNARALADVSRARAESAALANLVRLVIDAETGERGFVITGDERFLEPYLLARVQFPAALEHARRLFVADREAQVGIDQMALLFNRWRAEVAVPVIDLRRSAGREGRMLTDAADMIATGAGKRLIDELRVVAQRLEARAHTEAEQQTGRAELALARGRAALIWSPLTVLGLGLLAAMLVSRPLLRRLDAIAQAAKSLSEGHAETRLSTEPADELGQLALSFNEMADGLAHRQRELAALSELGRLLQASSDPHQALSVLQRIGPQLLSGMSGAVYIGNASNTLLEARATWGELMLEDQVPLESCWALRSGRSHVQPDTRAGITCAHVDAASTGASLCLPLSVGIGQSSVLHLRSGTPVSGFPMPVIEAVAEQLGLALANLNLREKLREQSVRDPLTGLFNRRYLEETLERELARATRGQRSVGVLVLDVDHFKRFNDTHGHDAGDLVLREVGRQLARGTRKEDVACRYGGEEFVVVLPTASLEETGRRAEAIRTQMQQIALIHGGQTLGAISVSVGCAAFPVNGDTPDALIAAADQALYRAKREGRDRVMLAA